MSGPTPESEIEAECEKILSTDDKPKEPLWHYCGADGCVGIVSTDEMFATHYGFTNDTEELQRGEKVVLATLQRLAASDPNQKARELYDMIAKSLPGQQFTDLADAYLACFTAAASPDDLTQWSGYGHRGTGYALQLDLQLPSPVPEGQLAVMLVRVLYDDDEFSKLVEQQLDRYIQVYLKHGADPALKKQVGVWMMRECASLSPRLKHRCFAHEKEWRLLAVPMTKNAAELIEFRKREPNMLVPYVKISIGRAVRLLVAGPAHGGEERARYGAAKMLLARYNYDSKLAKLSPIPYRG